MRLHILLDLFTRQSLRIETPPQRDGCRAHEWVVVVEKIEACSIDPQVAPQRLVFRICAALERLVKCQSVRISLPPENFFEVARSIHQFDDQLSLTGTQTGGMERHFDFTKPGQALIEIRDHVQIGGLRALGRISSSWRMNGLA